MVRKFFSAVFSALLLCVGFADVSSAAFPEKAIKILVPYNVGGGNDLSARLFAKYWEKELGVSVTVTNLLGGGGIVAEQEVLKSKPDGYTILWQHHVLFANNSTGLTKHGREDYTPLFTAMSSPFCLFGNKDLAENSVEDLVKTMKEKPGSLSWAYKPMSNTNFYFLDVMNAFGVDPKTAVRHITNIANDQPRLINVMQGNVSITMNGLSSVLPYIKSGDVKIFALSGTQRNPQAPDVKTLLEMGYDATLAATTFFALAPKGLPDDIVKILDEAAHKVALNPAFIEEAGKLGFAVSYLDGAEFAEQLKKENDKFIELADKFGIHK